MKAMRARFALLLTAALGVMSAQAAELSPEERLKAIRSALVEAAMKSNTRVSSTSWMDAQGSMRELNRFSSEIKLRELQVQKYGRDENQEPQAELMSAVEPVVASRCDAPQAKAAIKQVMTLGLDMSPSIAPHQRMLAQQVGFAVRTRILEQATVAKRWRLVTDPVHHGAYNRLSYGHGEEHIQWHMQITMAPATFEASTVDVPAYLVQWQIRAPGQREAWFTTQHTVFGSAAFPVAGSPKIDSDLAQTIGQVAQQMAQQLDERLACDPQAFAVAKPTQGGTAKVNAGSKAGLRVGDKLMVADDRVLPAHALEPGALDAAVLAEVKSVSAYQAELKQVAGKNQKMQGGWVAWPYTY
jgi:hypothetical protein